MNFATAKGTANRVEVQALLFAGQSQLNHWKNALPANGQFKKLFLVLTPLLT